MKVQILATGSIESFARIDYPPFGESFDYSGARRLVRKSFENVASVTYLGMYKTPDNSFYGIWRANHV